MATNVETDLPVTAARNQLRVCRAWTAAWTAARTAVFGAVFLTTATAIAIALPQARDTKVLLIAAISALALAGIEQLEAKYGAGVISRLRSMSGGVWPLLGIAAAVLVVYFPIRNVYFLADDIPLVHAFSQPSLESFLRLFSTDLSQDVWSVSLEELRPLYGLTYMAGYLLSGADPLGYHLIALVAHILCAWLVYLIAKHAAGCDTGSATFAALLFAVLPIHSQTIPWISGSLTETIPSLFYLAAFLCFVRYRSEARWRYLFLSLAAFAAALLSKEVAVTLPVLLLSWDVFRGAAGRSEAAQGNPSFGSRFWAFLVPYLPLAAALGLYLGVRRMAFPSYLRENVWGASLPQAVSGIPAFFSGLHGGWTVFRNLHEFNVRESLLPLSKDALGVALGLLLVWTGFLLRDRVAGQKAMAWIVYFGLVWYLLSSVPLLFHPWLVIRRLYLPMAGPCIAVAVLGMRASEKNPRTVLYSRLAGALFLVILSATVVRKLDRQWVHAGQVSEKLKSGFAAALQQMPEGSLVVVTAPWALPPDGLDRWNFGQTKRAFVWGWVLPYALQPPFTAEDHYARVRIIEDGILYCCLLEQWWRKAREGLISSWQGEPSEQVEVHRLSWDDRTESVQWTKRRIAKGELRASVETILGKSLESAESADEIMTQRLMAGLVQLFP